MDKNNPQRNVTRFWLIALAVTIVGLLIIGFFFTNIKIEG